MANSFIPFRGNRYMLTQDGPLVALSSGDSSSRYDHLQDEPPAGQPDQDLTASQVLVSQPRTPDYIPVIDVDDPDVQLIEDTNRGNILTVEQLRDVAASWLYSLPDHRFVQDLRETVQRFVEELVVVLSVLEARIRLPLDVIPGLQCKFANMKADVASFLPQPKRPRTEDQPLPTVASDSDSADDED